MNDLYAPIVKAEDKPVIFAIKMPLAMRDAFKAHCESHKIEMSEVIRRFITRELESAVRPMKAGESVL